MLVIERLNLRLDQFIVIDRLNFFQQKQKFKTLHVNQLMTDNEAFQGNDPLAKRPYNDRTLNESITPYNREILKKARKQAIELHYAYRYHETKVR